jgi:hypothetical protein
MWVDNQPRLFSLCVPDFMEELLKEVPDDCKNPYDFHKLFLPDEFVDVLVRTSRIYAVRKGRPDLSAKITSNSLRTSMAIMYLTGYLTPSNRLMYWEQQPDTSNIFVKKAMSRNLFMDLIRFTYFVDKVLPTLKTGSGR